MAETYLNMVNRLCDLVGERRYTDATQFNSTTMSDHEKVQLQAKEWFSYFHQAAMVTPRARFLLRDFTFNTADGDNTYNLDATTNYERILEDSMYVTTSGSEYGPLKYMDLFDEYRREFVVAQTSEGKPTRYFHYLRTATDGPDVIGFDPIPDATYAIRYSAFIKPYRLRAATDQICVDEEWEHIFLIGSAMFLEILKAEGKGGDFAAFYDKLMTEFEQHTVPTAEEHMRLDPTAGGALGIYGRRGCAEIWEW